MEVQEFDKQNSRKIMLLPGNMMSWRQFEAVIPLLEKQYQVIAVSTDGYDGYRQNYLYHGGSNGRKAGTVYQRRTGWCHRPGAWRIHGRRNGRYAVPPAKS